MTETRNIINYYHYWETDAIKADLDTKRQNFSVLCTNLIGDFNIGSIIRNANAFLAKEVIIYGKKQYDKRGTVGTYHYSNLKHVRSIEDFEESSPIVCIDNVDNSKNIETYEWPKEHFIMVFGEENRGVPQEFLDKAKDIVYIPQLGSVRSLNVGCASAIAMFDFSKKIKCQQ